MSADTGTLRAFGRHLEPMNSPKMCPLHLTLPANDPSPLPSRLNVTIDCHRMPTEMGKDIAPTRLPDRLEKVTPTRVICRPRQFPADSPQCADAVLDSDCLPMLRKLILSKDHSVHVCAGAQPRGLSTRHLEPSLNVAVVSRHGSACSLAHRCYQPSSAVALNPGHLPVREEPNGDHSLYVCAGSRPRRILPTPSHTKHNVRGYANDSYTRNCGE